MDPVISMFILFISKEVNYDLNQNELINVKKFVNLQIKLAPWFISYTIFFISHFSFELNFNNF